MIKTPILFIIFNRPDTTEQVFAEIKKQKPNQLYIAADGPRENRDGEYELCLQTRKIIEKIDWECDVKTLFRESNLGCKKAVSSAIDWFFDNVEEGIILEDDCLPDTSFFSYCENMLEKYRHDDRVMHISGENPTDSEFDDTSYYFTRTAHVWGWASWRRAWKLYDVEMKSYKEFKEKQQIKDVFNQSYAQKYWLKVFDRVVNNEIDTWDYQWMYTLYTHDGLSAIPNKNLISNIGFGAQATHTSENSELANRPTQTLTEIVHPEEVIVNEAAQKLILKERFGVEPRTPWFLLSRELHRAFSKLKR